MQSHIERVTVRPTGKKGFEVEFEGDLAQMIDLASVGERPAVPEL